MARKRNVVGNWINEEASARRYNSDKSEAARVVEMLGGKCLWVAWNQTTGASESGQANNMTLAKKEADKVLVVPENFWAC